jgi:formate hydrogenlyase subunit 4
VNAMPFLLVAIHLAILVAVSPVLGGVIARTKSVFAGRRGPPVLQPYFDLVKLARKGTVYSRTTTWVFRAGPVVGLAATLVAGLLVPFTGSAAPLAFEGDVILFAYLLGLARFATILAAADTGSSFEGMGASREATFGALAEPALFAGLLVLALGAKSLCLSVILGPHLWALWGSVGPALVLVAVSFAILLLVENCRIPADDPNTHLELTMIHEVMVLDHGGPDLAMILVGAAVKLFLYAAILTRLVLPTDLGAGTADVAVRTAAFVAVAVGIGVAESAMARLRMNRVPVLIGGALVLSTVAIAVLFSVGGAR